jgi:5-methylthioribose kinase
MPLDIEDPADLTTFLRRRGLDADHARFERLDGGVSNRTVLVSWADGHAWVIKQALARLRVAADWRCSPERVHREALGGRWLSAHCPGAVPRIVLEDEDEHLLAMDAVPQPHENWKAMLLAGRVEPAHLRQFGELLGAIHRAGADVPEPFGDWTYFEALRLEPF